MEVKGTTNECSEENEGHVITNLGKGDPCYIVGRSSVELWSITM